MNKSRKTRSKITLGPVITILILIVIVIGLSSILSLAGVGGQKTQIVGGDLESKLVTINNVLTPSGIKMIITNAVTNLKVFEPFFLLVITLIALGIGKSCGLFQILFKPLKKINKNWIIVFTLLVGILSSVIGEYSYILLIPLIGIIYQYAGQKPMLGILTLFIGITVGYGTGLFFSYDDYFLGTLTQASANVLVDPNYEYSLSSNIYIMIASTILLTVSGLYVIKKLLDPKIKKVEIEQEEYKESKKALFFTAVAGTLMALFLLYMIIPGMYKSGLLLGEGENYIIRLLGPESPFRQGFLIIVLLFLMITSAIYGRLSKNIENTNQYSLGLSKEFEDLGYLFVLLFFTAQLAGILEWTNLGEVLVVNLLNLISTFDFSGLLLIILTFISVIIMSILMPSNTTKWALISPILVPLFMRANVTPSFTQFVFTSADAVGKTLTPLFTYFIIMLAFLEKYNENEKITIFGTLKKIMPTVLIFAAIWFIFILCWYITGLPTGIGVNPTL